MAEDDTPKTRLERLYRQQAQLQARIRQMEARGRVQSRKEDTRRKIIAGALALEHAEKDEAFRDVLHGLLNRYVTRPQDRALFGLSPSASLPQDNRPEAPPAFSESAAG